jgi:polar amino acid transport system substrate-binding protein
MGHATQAAKAVIRRRGVLKAAAALGAAGAWPVRAALPEAVRVGHDAPFEPFAFVADGRSQGMLIEVIEQAVRSLPIRCTFVPLALDRIERELEAGTIDAIAFKGVTPGRQRVMDFSDPLVMTGGAAFTRLDLPASGDLAGYAGRTVVTPRQGPLAAQIAEEFPQLKLLTVDSYESALAAVLSGQADVAALNFQVGTRLVNQKYRGRFNLPAEPYTRLPLAFAVWKGRQRELLAAVNESVAKLKADGSMEAITRKWLGG